MMHLFWLVRTNTVLPYVYGTDEGQNILVNICQHGSLHIDTLNKETDDLLKANLSSTGLLEIQGNNCVSPWAKHCNIAGRSIIV